LLNFFWAIYSQLEIDVSGSFNWNCCRGKGNAEETVKRIEYDASFQIPYVRCNDVLSGNFIDNYTFILNNGKKIITTFNVSSDNEIYQKGRKIKSIVKKHANSAFLSFSCFLSFTFESFIQIIPERNFFILFCSHYDNRYFIS
jgi:hypothetical protein